CSSDLGAAGIDVADEFARIESLLETAKELGIPVIAMHVEGGPRRGATSDDLSRLVFPYADYAIVRADGNDDGFFSDLAAEFGVTLSTVEKSVDAAAVLRSLYCNLCTPRELANGKNSAPGRHARTTHTLLRLADVPLAT